MELTVSIEPLSAMMINPLLRGFFSFLAKAFTIQQRHRVLTSPCPCLWAPPILVVFI